MNRRDFLRGLLASGIATAATPAIVEPVRKLFFVPSNAPVGSRVERFEGVDPTPANFARWVNEQIRREHDDRLYMFREQRTREELAAMYPEPTGTLFGIDASSYPEWKAARYTQTDAARLFRELTLSYANPETVTGGCDRSRT